MVGELLRVEYCGFLRAEPGWKVIFQNDETKEILAAPVVAWSLSQRVFPKEPGEEPGEDKEPPEGEPMVPFECGLFSATYVADSMSGHGPKKEWAVVGLAAPGKNPLHEREADGWEQLVIGSQTG